jgi:hypothetical protein
MDFHNKPLSIDYKNHKTNFTSINTEYTSTEKPVKRYGLKILNKLEQYSQSKKLSSANITQYKPLSSVNVIKSLLNPSDTIIVNIAKKNVRDNLSIDFSAKNKGIIETENKSLQTNEGIKLPVIKNINPELTKQESANKVNKLNTIKSKLSVDNLKPLTLIENKNNIINRKKEIPTNIILKPIKKKSINIITENAAISIGSNKNPKGIMHKADIKKKKKRNCLFTCFA